MDCRYAKLNPSSDPIIPSLSDTSENLYRLHPERRIHAFMFEGRSTSVQLCAAQPFSAQLVPPVVADAARNTPRKLRSAEGATFEELFWPHA